SEARFDALDGSSKEPFRITVKIAPGAVHPVPTSDAAPTGSLGTKRHKAQLASNFQVTIPSVDCTRVTRVEPIVISASGGKMSCANLVLSVAEPGTKDFVDWHRQTVVEGKTGADTEKSVTIQLLSPNKDVELTLQGRGVGILAVRPVPNEPGSEAVRRVAVEMYVQRWELNPTGSDSAPAKPADEASTPKVKPPPRKPRG